MLFRSKKYLGVNQGVFYYYKNLVSTMFHMTLV
ncbi:hypothetical protein PSM36_3502 [Proteiniphilum saccharofermentans]|jgi:hypothetical protein|uniref:Uncharacterized protein n=1 Tax=Proteiniphilum saccharofermentans TaxID=1642647 RepID=A0A1R3TF57_9BACT|nr:hypothetical protein PSM36_3502 [Proteiniphilum saccharofermentans]